MQLSRRSFLQAGTAAGVFATFPNLIAAELVTGAVKPNGRINIGIVGCGRIANSLEIPNIVKYHALARIVAVCDIDAKRLAYTKARVERDYDKALKTTGTKIRACARYEDIVADPDIDAVMVCVPDFWHALVDAAAILAGKSVWAQKPFSQTIREGRILANLAKMKGTVLQVASQSRSLPTFHDGCEFVRNGRLGEIARVEVGFGCDKPGGSTAVEPVPEGFDYDRWLGPTDASAPYNHTRVHDPDVKNIGRRPGWMQVEPYDWGMITNWGAHYLDIVQWGLGTEATGPLGVAGTCQWLDHTGGKLWNVHSHYDLHYTYAGGIDVHVCDKYEGGIRFFNKKGDWICVSRGDERVTKSDGNTSTMKRLGASRPELLAPLEKPDVKLIRSEEQSHFLNWLTAIRNHTPATTVTNAEAGHRSTSVCLLGHMCMKTGKTLAWDPVKEVSDNAEANAMMKPFARGVYDLKNTLAKYGLTEEGVLKG